MLQSHAVQKLHGNERPAVLLANVINRADVGMIQRGCGLRFALKTGQGLRIAGNVFRQEFKCDKTMKPRVLGFVDHAHATAPEFLDNAVVRDGLADHWRESYVGDTGKSKKGFELALCQKGRSRKIPMALTDLHRYREKS